MTDLDYRKLYCELYNNSLTYEKYIPVKEYMQRIIHAYHEAMSEELDFTKDLVSLFDMVIEHNDYDNLDHYIDFLIKIHTPWYDVSDFLKLIMFPKEVYIENRDIYYNQFEELCSLINYKIDIPSDNLTRIEEALKLFQKYQEIMHYFGYYGVSYTLFGVFPKRYVPIIVGYFYSLDKPINYLDKILNDFVSNFSEIIDKSLLSGVHDLNNYKSSLGNEAEYIFFEHFVDIDNFSNKEIK